MTIHMYNKQVGSPKISISQNGVGIYAATIDLLGCPDYVMLGYDDERRAIVLIPAGSPKEGGFKIKGRARSGGYVTINTKGYLAFLKSQDSHLAERIDNGEVIRCLARKCEVDEKEVIIAEVPSKSAEDE